MFPVLVTITTPEQLRAVHALLSGETTEAAPAKTVKPKKETAAPAAQTQAAAPAAAAPASTGLSAAGQAFLQGSLAGPVMELSMKDEPAMKAIVAQYGVERVSLIPEKLFPEVLAKVNAALDPGKAERDRLEALDKSGSLI